MSFHPLYLSPLLSFFSYPSNVEIIFDFSDIITKIHPPFQNLGSALVLQVSNNIVSGDDSAKKGIPDSYLLLKKVTLIKNQKTN